MGDLSLNWSRAELACKCGCGLGINPGDIDPLLVDGLQRMREILGRPIWCVRRTPNGLYYAAGSGCRCVAHNRHVGGSPNSQHLFGKAADIWGHSPHILRAVALQVPQFEAGGIGYYPTRGFLHVDVRKTRSRWTL
jgi:uncharacterized protein YcbK (DUF882 family)